MWAMWGSTAKGALLVAAWLLTRGLRDAPQNAINDARARLTLWLMTAAWPDAWTKGHKPVEWETMSERAWLRLAEVIIKLARLAQGRLRGKRQTIINDARAVAGSALSELALICLWRSERRGGLRREGGRGRGGG